MVHAFDSFSSLFVTFIHIVAELKFIRLHRCIVSPGTNMPQINTCNIERTIWAISKLKLLTTLLLASHTSFGICFHFS